MVAALRKDFKRALSSAQHRRRCLFLELYSGDGGISKCLRDMGYGVMSFDIVNGPQFDLTRKCVQQLLHGWLTSGCILGAWLGTICKSWSRARHGPPGSGWCTVRDNAHIMGLADLPESAQLAVRLGNATMRQRAAFIKLAYQIHVPTMLENPCASMLWLAPRRP